MRIFTTLCNLIFFILLAASAVTRAQTPTPSITLGHAEHGIDTLQSWYDQGTGLYKTTGWWNSANALTVLVDDARLQKTDRYNATLANTFQAAQTKFKGFLNDYYDDEGWWALAWVDAYDLTQKPEYLAMAASIFENMSGGWDPTCGGGIWWSKERKYKAANANELFLSVAAHLAVRANGTDRKKYANWARKEWKWFHKSGMINAQGLVNDGLDTATCKNNGKTTWTYNQGVVIGGLAELQKVKKDKKQMQAATGIADATLTHLADAKGVLHDSCEPKCGSDGVQFKGIFMRNLVQLNRAAPDSRFATFAATNAASIWDSDQGLGFQFGEVWSGPFGSATAATQTSALDAILAAAAMGAGTGGS